MFGLFALQPASAGALPTLRPATEAAPGSYSGPRWLGEVRGPAVGVSISSIANDAGLASQLRDLSEELTEVRYDWVDR